MPEPQCATYCYSSAVPSNLHFFYPFNLSLFPRSSYLSLLDCFSVSISPLSDYLSVCCLSSLDLSNHSLSLSLSLSLSFTPSLVLVPEPVPSLNPICTFLQQKLWKNHLCGAPEICKLGTDNLFKKLKQRTIIQIKKIHLANKTR